MATLTDTGAHRPSQRLNDFGPAYFDHVFAQFQLFKMEQDIPPYIQEIIDRHTAKPELLTWKDVFALEEFVLKIQPDDVVKARAPGLEESYREIVGPQAYNAYLKLRPGPKDDGFLRTVLARLLDSLHWVYSMIPAREQMRSEILRQSGKWLLICFVLFVPMVLVCSFKGYTLIATLPLVALMGALGGFLSLQRRLQNMPTNRDPFLTMLELQNGRFTVGLAPLVGAVFAVVLFLIFLGGLLQGAIFPGQILFSHWELGRDPITPEALKDVSKLLLWSFIAGFAEKFVPDTLDSLTSKGRQSSTSKPSEAATGGVERKASEHLEAGHPESIRQESRPNHRGKAVRNNGAKAQVASNGNEG
jgi:hypothetical protein